MAHLSIKVSGRGRVGGEGLALWYTKNRGVAPQLLDDPASAVTQDPTGASLGPVYGSDDFFQGFGLVFDTYDEKTGNVSCIKKLS